MNTTSVLFVCLGNICRSPMAEGVFRRMVEDAGLRDAIRVDSAGASDWHAGKQPDRRAIAIVARRGIDITGLRARQVRQNDFTVFDHILVMDRGNLAALQRMAVPGGTIPELFLRYVPGASVDEMPDPYMTGGFDKVLELIEAAAAGLLRSLRKQASADINTKK